MKKLLVLGAVLSGMIFSAAAGASITKGIRDAEKACLQNAESNMDLKECAGTAYQAANVLLERSLEIWTTNLRQQKSNESIEILVRLEKSQQAWVTYRVTNCSLQGTTMLGGTGEGLTFVGCMSEETLNRIDNLKNILDSGR